MNDNLKKIVTQMRRGTLEYCVLTIISKGTAYSSDLLLKLKDAELIVVEGTLYPLLTRLKKEGYLSYAWVESVNGPPRKYYSLTPEGEEFLKQLDTEWNNLYKSIKSLQK
jgi:PadR family transcriptional regulator PadR